MIQRATAFMKRHTHIQWALVDQAMVSGVNFLTGILLARFLGIEEFGRFTLAWMTVLFVNSITHSLVNAPMMSIGPKQDESDIPAYYGSVMIQIVVLAMTAFMLLFLGISLIGSAFPDWGIDNLALPLASVALAFQVQDFLRRYFFTRGRAVLAFAGDAIRYLGQIAVLIWLFVFLGTAMETATVLWIIALLATTAAAMSVFFIGRLQWNRTIFHTTVIRHWNFSKWLSASAIMRWGKENFLIIISGGLLGVSAVGALQAAKSIMGVNHILFLGLENVVPARAAKLLKHEGQAAMIKYFRRVACYGGVLTTAFSIIAAVMPEFWLNLLFGEEYRGFGALLQWYAAIYVLMFVSILLRFALRSLELTQPIFLANLAGASLTILFAYSLISNFGTLGAVGGSFGIQIMVLGMLWIFISKNLKSKDG